jgi:hypothetical protein
MTIPKYYRDLTERVVATFLGTFVAALASSGPANVVDLSVWQSAGLAGMGAVAALVKGTVARAIGSSDSASVSRRI